jgi:hypothetical protein
MRRRIAATVLGAVLALAAVTTLESSPAQAAGAGINDPACRPTAAHPYPVVVLHGLGATYYEDLNFLQADIASKGYCTFSLTYGAYPGFPYVGGLQPIATSAPQIASYIQGVLAETGATKVDIVGHSEGGSSDVPVASAPCSSPILVISQIFQTMPRGRRGSWLSTCTLWFGPPRRLSLTRPG